MPGLSLRAVFHAMLGRTAILEPHRSTPSIIKRAVNQEGWLELLAGVAVGVDRAAAAALRVAEGIIGILVSDGSAPIGQRPHAALPIQERVAGRPASGLRQHFALAHHVAGLGRTSAIGLQHHIPVRGGFIPEIVGDAAAYRLLHPPPISVITINISLLGQPSWLILSHLYRCPNRCRLFSDMGIVMLFS